MDKQLQTAIRKLVEQKEKIFVKYYNFEENSTELSHYDESFYVYAHIIKSIINDPKAFRMFEIAEQQHGLLEELTENYEFNTSTADTAFKAMKYALELLGAQIAPALESTLANKINKLSNEDAKKLQDSLSKLEYEIKETLSKVNLSEVQLGLMLVSSKKESERTKISQEEVVASKIQDVLNVEHGFASDIANLAIASNEIPTIKQNIDKLAQRLKNFSQKGSFKDIRGVESPTPRADYYYSMFVNQIFSPNVEYNRKNREEIFKFASRMGYNINDGYKHLGSPLTSMEKGK